MKKEARLQAEIDNAVSRIEKTYSEALGTLKELKDRLNLLERVASQGKTAVATNSADTLHSVAARLNSLSDSMILENKKAWQTYDRLERECKARGLAASHLDDLRVLCKRIEQTAADLLCYSLGHLRHTES